MSKFENETRPLYTPGQIIGNYPILTFCGTSGYFAAIMAIDESQKLSAAGEKGLNPRRP
jgi:hypothetical protein